MVHFAEGIVIVGIGLEAGIDEDGHLDNALLAERTGGRRRREEAGLNFSFLYFWLERF